MQQTRRDKTALNREAILNSALDEFTEKGFAAARMEDIARRAGVAKGTIYLNFADKESLFEAIVTQEIVPLIGAAKSPLAPGETVRGFLERTVLPLLQDFPNSRRGLVMRLIVTEGCHFPKLAEVYYRKVIAPGLAAFGTLAKHAVKTGELGGDALVRFPQLMIAPAILSVVWSGLFERLKPLDTQEMLRAHFDQIFGMAKDAKKPSKSKRSSVAKAGAKA